MTNSNLYFYHPSTVLFIDDNQAFLDMLSINTIADGPQCFFDEPEAALTYLAQQSTFSLPNFFQHNDNETFDLPSESLGSFSLNQLHHLAYNRHRFQHISTIVADYAMPAMNGLEFLQRLPDPSMKKILLTGQADESIAIDAFNRGIIDHFITKQAEDVNDGLRDKVRSLSASYFAERGQVLSALLPQSLRDLLASSVYIDLFQGIKKQARAVEYYLLDIHGSFLFIDAQGQLTCLMVRSEQALQEQYDTLLAIDAQADLITAIEQRQQLLFFLSDQEQRQPTQHWFNYLHPMQRLDTQHFYAVASGQLANQIDAERIIAYADATK